MSTSLTIQAAANQATTVIQTTVVQAADLSDRLQGLVSGPGVPPVAFALAFLAGAGHAVTPGHGKSLAAAYLVGSRGRVRDAAWLGGSVAAMHTISVLVIALAWTFLSLSDVIRMPELTTWLELVAGLLVVATGLWLVRRHLHNAGHPHHHHTHPHHHHSHSHGQQPGHPVGARAGQLDSLRDDHHPPGDQHSHEHGKRPGLVLLGMSGGLTPSPAAFLVLVTGLFLGRAGFALLLVLTFGVGMAVVLFGVGLLALAGNSLVLRGARSHSLLRHASRLAPVLAAVGITVFGVGLTTVAAIHLTAVT
ncbi:nickel/cobalt transporter [Plantactinospora endophytica]|uniref:Nickel/cobalt efflux system n=1 Tax=Plantactinospora endophytica TaxID=673535 RepID=A0ABQ4ED65_9ACTN|nr:cobalt transporter [Plantactinospora endophytica]GIG92670.1 nickel/cobalt efflux system [Plantactinospora endophytica]